MRVSLLAGLAVACAGSSLATPALKPPSHTKQLLALRGGATAQSEDDMGKVTLPRAGAYLGSALLVSLVTSAQIVTPVFLESKGAAGTLISCAHFAQTQKKAHPLGMTLFHAIVSKSCADVVAQAIPQQGSTISVDVLRVIRSMLACVLSISIPFYYWTKLIHASFGLFRTVVEAGSLPASLKTWLTAGFGSSLLKTGVTQLIFRPLDVGLYLSLQSIFRGDTARQLVTMLHRSYLRTLIGGIIFYSFSNLLMFMIPTPYLHPIFGSLAGSIFAVWLAMQAYRAPK
jgi:hypothetical protein